MPESDNILNPYDHSRDAAGLTYVYPVVSRRSEGVSIGINLNTNNACNWRCIYCQVPELQRGSAPAVDLIRLESELYGFLREVVEGDFMQKRVPPEARRLNDIALSGNGEPTSAREFGHVVTLIGRVMREFNLVGQIKLVLITNGSLVNRIGVQNALRHMAGLNGEVWFKLDRATDEGVLQVNNVHINQKQVIKNLTLAAALCPTWVQTCMLAIDGEPPAARECDAYIQLLAQIKRQGTPLRGVLLYGLARPSMQLEAPRLSNLPTAWLEKFAREIEAQGFPVKLCD